MSFASQAALWLLALVPALALVMAWGLRRRRRRLQEFGQWPQVERLVRGARLGVHRVRLVLLTAATALLAVALARPQFGQVEETLLARGVDIVIAVDVSHSMLADDIPPTRLERAREQLQGLITRLSGHRMAILAFAGSAIVQCPLTLDQAILHQTMSIVDEDAVGAEGTNLADAVRVALRAFDDDSPRHRVIVLLTDGEDHGGAIDAVAREAAEAQAQVFAVAIGTASGSAVPQFDPMGRRTGFRQDSGRPVLTRVQTLPLMTLARLTGGRAYETTNLGGAEIDAIAREIAALPQRDIEEQRVRHRAEQFQVFLLPAIGLLVFDTLLLTGRRRRRESLASPAAAAAVLALFAVSPGRADEVRVPREAARENNAGVAAHREGEYEAALEHYQQAEVTAPNTPEVLLNIGHLRYMQNDLPEAERQFELAREAASETVRATAQYNLGTARLREAQRTATEGEGLDRALEQVNASIDDLRQSLITAPGNWEARYNLELAMRLRDQWREQQREQPQSQSSQSGGQGQQQQSQSSPGQEGEPEQPQSQGEPQSPQGQEDQSQPPPDQPSESPPQSGSDPSEQEQQQSGDSRGSRGEQQQTGGQSDESPGQPPMTPEQIAAAQDQSEAEALLDLIPFREYPGGMRNLMGAQAMPPPGGPDW